MRTQNDFSVQRCFRQLRLPKEMSRTAANLKGRRTAVWVATAVLAALSAASLHAQVSPSMDSPMTPDGLPEQAPSKKPAPGSAPATPAQPGDYPGQSTPADADADQAPTLKVATNIVNVFFNVRDKENQYVTSLTKNDCTVLENGKPRPIQRFELIKNQSLTLGVLIDTSGSQQDLLPMEQEDGYHFLREVLRPLTDEAFVISFDIHVDLLGDFTSDYQRLHEDLNRAQINTGTGGGDFIPGLGTQRGTLLYDAVYLASHDVFKPEAGRHAMVLLTDGDDEGSKVKLKEAIEAAQRADAVVYVVLLYDPAIYLKHGWVYSGDRYVRQLVEETGGRVFNVGVDRRKFEASLDALNEGLHKQYQLSFEPASVDGKFHKLSIQCKGDGLKIDARKGFYASATQ